MITLDKVASPDYREQLQKMTDAGVFAGSGQRYAAEVVWLALKFKAVTILDYGAGSGTLRMALKGCPFVVREFDPGNTVKAAMPEPADIVNCTDVLEHVEPERLKFVIKHLYDLTKVAAFIVVATRPAEKRLPDGRNAHLIIDNAPWWYEQLCRQPWDVHVHRYALVDTTNAYFWIRKVR